MMPHDLPPWDVVYQQTQRWLKAEVFQALVQDLRAVLRIAEGRQEMPTAAIFDSRTMQSTPESGGRAGYDGAKGRKGNKVHLAVDTLGRLLAFARFKISDLYHKVRFIRGVYRVVSFGDGPTSIDEEIIGLIQSNVKEEGFVRINEEVKPGDRVIVKAGPLKNFAGIFEREMKDTEHQIRTIAMIAEMAKVEEYRFQAETSKLLDLMIHSLYTDKEIFLRELISNASDALDRLRFEALTDPTLLEENDKYEIRLETDKEARTLSIFDMGIGMSRDEVIANIGTIAKSGTDELRKGLEAALPGQMAAELIGRFGVGFYSSFMVADKVVLITRKAGEKTATRWESTADGVYFLSEAERDRRGTTITLYLKPANPELGIEDYTDQWVLSRIVRKYSDFVTYPIIGKYIREETGKDGGLAQESNPTVVIEDKILNSMNPIWNRPQAEVSESEYADFYRHISNAIKVGCVFTPSV